MNEKSPQTKKIVIADRKPEARNHHKSLLPLIFSDYSFEFIEFASGNELEKYLDKNN